ncbi:hypothetical protein DFH27DRAFT_521687 [Peziza echinospora]|nr:hypothetical protein DFH27DRAFT_521687 [Peziza echinospora]
MANSTRSSKRSNVVVIPFHIGTPAELYASEDAGFTPTTKSTSSPSTSISTAAITRPMDIMGQPPRSKQGQLNTSFSLPSSIYGTTASGNASGDGLTGFSGSSSSPMIENTPPPKKRRVKGSIDSTIKRESTQELDRDGKRGEKWTEEEEARLWERRTCPEPESWEITSSHFDGRSTNALQKKYKLMVQAARMAMDPEDEARLKAAYEKHKPQFLKSIRSELGMFRTEKDTEDMDIIEERLAALFIQGKLPIKLSMGGNGGSNMGHDETSLSPMLHHARPSTAPPQSTNGSSTSPPSSSASSTSSRPRHYTPPDTAMDYSAPSKFPTDPSLFSYDHNLPHDSPNSLSPIESPVLNSAYPSDSDEWRHSYNPHHHHQQHHHHHAMEVFTPSGIPFTDYTGWSGEEAEMYADPHPHPHPSTVKPAEKGPVYSSSLGSYDDEYSPYVTRYA